MSYLLTSAYGGYTDAYAALLQFGAKGVRADCVCDIGSRDGEESLFFRHLVPDAVVLAFEASPSNYEMMAAREDLKANRIEIFPYAISNRNGRATFYVTDDQADKDAMRQRHNIPQSEDVEKITRGTSSLLAYEGALLKQL
jgi:FkbM family methyltransferase